MPREKTSVSREDYLKAIWGFIQEGQTPIAARLAEELDVTPPAVAAALKRMARDGYLRVRAGGVIRLTPKGRAIADKLVLRHRLAEKLLNEVIGVEWSRVHEEAERLEHGISDEVAALLLKRFGPDTTCPHGVPLRGGMAKLRRNRGALRLSEAQPGDRLEVLRVYEKDPTFLEFIERRRLRPRARLRVLRREYDETMTLAVGGRRVYLGQPATSRIWVRRISV